MQTLASAATIRGRSAPHNPLFWTWIAVIAVDFAVALAMILVPTAGSGSLATGAGDALAALSPDYTVAF